MKYCPNCGTARVPGDRFCGECGTDLQAFPQAAAAGPAVPHRPAVAPPAAPVAPPAPPRRPRPHWVGTLGRVLLALALSLPVAALGGWAAHFLPQDLPGTVRATGSIDETTVPEPLGTAEGVEALTGLDEGLTAFLTSCGKLLDVVPTRAVSNGTALEVELEFRPVCPTGEWISSRRMRIDLSDTDGVPFAQGSFDFSEKRVFVPGFGDPTSRVTAEYGRGTAWAAPESLAERIADGSVHVDCVPLDGGGGEPLADGESVESPEVTVAAEAIGDRAGSRRTALAALRRQARLDDSSLLELEGSWIPQLSSKIDGTYDALDDRTYSLADIYQQYLSLRLRYPNVRLLNSSDWDAYSLKDYWVVVAGVPFIYPNQANRWCATRRIPPSQCFAKQLIRDGAPVGTTKHRR